MMPETKICHTDSNKTMKMKETYGAKHDKVDTIGKWQDATHYVFKKKRNTLWQKKGTETSLRYRPIGRVMEIFTMQWNK